jgi:hypothetical protein
MRVNQGQEFVIGGYTVGGTTFDALVFGYYEGEKLRYAGRTRNGFTPRSRAELLSKFKPLEITECPFANLPEKKAGRWGVGLTASKMADCRWLKPVLVGQFEFVEWTADGHLRHSRFMGLRDDKIPRNVRWEQPRSPVVGVPETRLDPRGLRAAYSARTAGDSIHWRDGPLIGRGGAHPDFASAELGCGRFEAFSGLKRVFQDLNCGIGRLDLFGFDLGTRNLWVNEFHPKQLILHKFQEFL